MYAEGYEDKQLRNLRVRINSGSHYEFKAVNNYSFLGMTISNVDDINLGIKTRLIKDSGCVAFLYNFIRLIK